MFRDESVYRRLIEMAPDAMVVMDGDGRIALVNVQAETFFGYSRDELLGQPIEILIPERFRNAHQGHTTNYLDNPHTRPMGSDLRLWGLRKDGTEFPIEVSLGPLEIEDGVYVAASIRDVTNRKAMAKELRKSERFHRTLLDDLSDGVALIMPDGHIEESNPAAERILGSSSQSFVGRSVFSGWEVSDEDGTPVSPDDYPATITIRTGKPQTRTLQVTRPDRSKVWLHVRTAPLSLSGETGEYATVVTFTDITERRDLERQLQHSQKMDAIGRLAGGISHDFNNLLTAILGYAELVQEHLDADDPLRADVQEIHRAGERASTLTGQLLAFSRQQIIQPTTLDLNTVVTGFENLLRRTIGEDIDLVTRLESELGRVKADSGQIEQIVMNLVVNARDAMAAGGEITIETANVEVGEISARTRLGVSPGHYVVLSVSDTGHGMDVRTQRRVFEPFFTTKAKDKGTGLGLSTVYGMVKQSNGGIWVHSEPGKGATFKIFLPRIEDPVEEAQPAKVAAKPVAGSETILLVEDDELVRRFAVQCLRNKGYEVLSAGEPAEALRICHENAGKIDLLITDLVLPGGTGLEVAEQVRAECSRIKILYISGYADKSILRTGYLDARLEFLGKPFSARSLTQKVREVLDKEEAS